MYAYKATIKLIFKHECDTSWGPTDWVREIMNFVQSKEPNLIDWGFIKTDDKFHRVQFPERIDLAQAELIRFYKEQSKSAVHKDACEAEEKQGELFQEL